MARFNYTGLENTARRLIDRFGKDAILIKPGAPTTPGYDPQPGAPTEHDIIIVDSSFSFSYRAGGTVKQGDKMVIVSTVGGQTPEMNDQIVDGADTYRIVNIDPVTPGSTTLLFKAHTRWASGVAIAEQNRTTPDSLTRTLPDGGTRTARVAA